MPELTELAPIALLLSAGYLLVATRFALRQPSRRLRRSLAWLWRTR